jgi:carbon monoxide dehydrogenase subunit G
MSTLTIEEKITVTAPPERVWELLLDPARVAACLPGARFDGLEGERTFLGTMKVKVGPVTMEFKGKATMSEIDEAARTVKLTGSGNDKSGSGSARMTMQSRVAALDGGGSEIIIQADVDLAGKLVSFGRGMMEGISKQLFKQFTERVRADLARAEAEAPKVEAPKVEEPKPEASKAEASKVEEPKAEAKPEEPKPEEPRAEESKAEAKPEEPRAEEPKVEAKLEEPRAEEPKPEEPKAVESKSGEAESGKAESGSAPKSAAPLAPVENAPLDAGNLVWAALWEWIKNLFRRLFGRR